MPLAFRITARINDLDDLQKVDSRTDLKAIAPIENGQRAWMQGFTSIGDGGEGEFVWDASSTATDDGGTIIQPVAGGTGRWKRVIEGPYKCDWFGAKGDGATNDTVAIQAALDACETAGGGTVLLSPRKTYLIRKTDTYDMVYISGATVPEAYSLLLPPRVTLDLNQSRLKLDAAQNCTMILNKQANSDVDDDCDRVGLRNGIIDQNAANQTIPDAGPGGAGETIQMPAVHLQNVTNAVVQDIRFENIRDGSLQLWDAEGCFVGNLLTQQCDGDIYKFGQSNDEVSLGYDLRVRHSVFGDLIAKNGAINVYPVHYNNYLSGAHSAGATTLTLNSAVTLAAGTIINLGYYGRGTYERVTVASTVSASTSVPLTAGLTNSYAGNTIASFGTALRQGNPLVGCQYDCAFGNLVAYSCGGGYKWANDSHHLSIGTIVWHGVEPASRTAFNSSSNSGVKFQGDSTTTRNHHISVGQIVTRYGQGVGLYLEWCDDFSLGQYVGELNGAHASENWPDVWMGNGVRQQISSVQCDAAGRTAVLVRAGCSDYQVGQCLITDNGQVAAATAFSNTSNSGGTVGSLICRNAATGMTIAYAASVSTAWGYVGRLESEGHTIAPVSLSTAFIRFGEIIADETAQTTGAVTLSAGTSTSVANANVYGISTSAGHLYPIIQFIPKNAAALRLARNDVKYRPNVYSSTGFTIYHAVAQGTETFQWVILGWINAAMPDTAGLSGNFAFGDVSVANAFLQLQSNKDFGIELAIPTDVTATPATSGGTLADDTYGYRVSAVGAGLSESCAEVTAIVSGGGGSGSVEIEWTAVTGASAYAIYRTDTPGTYGANSLVTASATGTSYVDTGTALTAGQPRSSANAYTNYLSPALNYLTGALAVGRNAVGAGATLDVQGQIYARERLRFATALTSYYSASEEASIYGTNSGGAGFPFDNAGHLILQARPETGAGIGLAAGDPANIGVWVNSARGVVTGPYGAALATNATDGFLWIPTCAGTPTGVPASYTGKCALVMDTTNHVLYVYDGSWRAMN